MSKEVTKVSPKTEAKPKHVRKARKATFTPNDNGTFTPVNKRAKTFAVVLGVKELTKANLKAIRKAGLAVRQYTSDGKLKAIAL